MKTKTLNKLIKDYQLIFANLGFKINQDFKKDYLHIKRMQTNGTKISFIKADKIQGLKKNIKGFRLKPNDTEQREKYFQAVKPSKLIKEVIKWDSKKENLFNMISEQFNKDYINNLKSKLVLYSGEDIGEQYNKYNDFSGCMGGCPTSYFKVYSDTEGLQLATLKDAADTLLIRALLWHDKDKNTYWLDNSYEQRAINGDEEVRQDYQKKLISEVLHILSTTKKDFKFGCSFFHKLSNEDMNDIEKEFNINIFHKVKRKEEEAAEDKDTLILSPKINDFNADDFDSFPYSDTFQSIGRTYGKWQTDDNQGDDNYVCCRSTEGQDENDSGSMCDCCEERTHEDEIHFSEVEQEYLCDECGVWIEERDDIARIGNTTYNNHTGESHYSHDLSQR
tara:strand:+ start:1083 stop:2258 length:1176 start_codon:yes stop_codon:yes gene_type:complete